MVALKNVNFGEGEQTRKCAFALFNKHPPVVKVVDYILKDTNLEKS